MKKTLTFLFALLWVISLFAQNQKEHYLELKIDAKKEIQALNKYISVDAIDNGIVKAYANTRQLEKLRDLGYEPKMLVHPSRRERVINMANTVEEMANWDKYPTYEVYEDMMAGFAADYPSLCTLDTIGTSTEGRKLLVLTISDNPDMEEAEPEFFYTSTMHGDETTGYVLMLRLIDYLLDNHGTDAQVTNLVNNVEILINPNANPDGTYASGNSTVSGATRGNANYIDLNRNFYDPDDGPNPDGNDWQNETLAMMEYARANTITMSANFHGGAEVANYPWDTWSRPHPDEEWFVAVSHVYADNAMADGPSGYFTSVSSNGVTNGYDWYPISGGRQDFYTYMGNGREVTMEVSDVKLLSTDELDAHWGYNKNALLLFMEEVLKGFHGTVTNPDGEPLLAEIKAIGHDLDQDSSMVFTDPDAGDFHRLIANGTYNFVAMANGHVPDTAENIVINDNRVTHHFVLPPADPVTLSGVVTDGENGQPIEGATLTVPDTEIDPVTTNADGQYSITLWEGNFTVRVSKDGYTALTETFGVTSENPTHDFALYGEIIEGFESGNLQSFQWDDAGSTGWQIDGNAYQGDYAAKSGSIGDEETSILELDVDVLANGDLSFYRKVSSEAGYDFLVFYIDGQEMASWSGEEDWAKVSFPLTQGSHTLTWAYEKDYSTTDHSDCAWIDQIAFPYIDISGPELGLPGAEVTLEADVNSTQVHELAITNTGGLSLNYSAAVVDAANHPWLSLSNAEGSISANGTANLALNIETPATPQTLEAQIQIAHNAPGGDTLVPVSVTVDYHPQFSYTPAQIEEIVYLQSADTVAMQISNTGSGEITYSWEKEASADNSWLQLEGTPTVLTDQTDGLQVVLDNAGLAEGDYTSYILLHNLTQAETDTIPVSMLVRARPELAASPGTITDEIGVGELASTPLKLKNQGGSNLHFHIDVPEIASSWLSLSQLDGLIAAGDSLTVEVRYEGPADDTLLTSYLDIIEEETGGQVRVPVTVEVASAPGFHYSPGAFDFEMTTGDAAPSGKLYIQNAGTGIIPYTLALDFGTGTPWASLAAESGSVQDETDSVALFVEPEGLQPGIYEATLLLTDQDQGQTYDIPMSLHIYDLPALVLNADTVFAELPQGQTVSRAIAVKRRGNQTIPYTWEIEDASPSWLSVRADAGQVTAEGADSLRFLFDATGMTPETYYNKVITENTYSGPDTVVVQLTVLPATSLTSPDGGKLRVYPQPFGQQLNLVLPGSGNAGVRVLSLHGRTLMQQHTKGRHVQLNNWQGIPAGLYILQIKQNGTFTARLIEKL